HRSAGPTADAASAGDQWNREPQHLCKQDRAHGQQPGEGKKPPDEFLGGEFDGHHYTLGFGSGATCPGPPNKTLSREKLLRITRYFPINYRESYANLTGFGITRPPPNASASRVQRRSPAPRS